VTQLDAHIDDRVGELLLGDVDEGERAAMEAHAAACVRCGQALQAATEAFALVGAALPAEPPPPSLRARILDEIAPKPMAAFVAKLAALFDVSLQRARALIDRLDAPDAWGPGPVAGSWVMMCDDPGPKLAGAFCGFVKMAPSVSWPRHTHLGTEHMLVLAGGFKQTDDGHEVHPGMTHTMTEGSTHGFVVFEDEGCISAAVVWGGVKFDDPSFKLGDLAK
jgi:anti-sigma factor ChrR (cupin superfamily)